MGNPYFRFKQFVVFHDQCAMKVNTDSCILGAVAGAKNPCRILDIGTGSGVLALMMAQRYANAMIDAVEIDREAARQAKENFLGSPWPDRLSVYSLPIQDFSDSTPHCYDLVVSNPPWWTRREKSPEIARRIARHDDFLSLEELTNIIGRIISPGGITFLLIPDPESGRMESILADLGFHISSKCLICTRRGQPFSRVIYGFSRIPSRVKVSEICIYGPDESYSDKFRELLGEFYLAL